MIFSPCSPRPSHFQQCPQLNSRIRASLHPCHEHRCTSQKSCNTSVPWKRISQHGISVQKTFCHLSHNSSCFWTSCPAKFLAGSCSLCEIRAVPCQACPLQPIEQATLEQVYPEGLQPLGWRTLGQGKTGKKQQKWTVTRQLLLFEPSAFLG